MTQKFEPEQIRYMIQHCLVECEDKLTKWEESFLESISDQFDSRGTLSEKQMEILDRVYTRLP